MSRGQGANGKKKRAEGRGGSKSPEKKRQVEPLKSAHEKKRELLKLKKELSEKEVMEDQLK
jgi:hypothetical protein